MSSATMKIVLFCLVISFVSCSEHPDESFDPADGTLSSSGYNILDLLDYQSPEYSLYDTDNDDRLTGPDAREKRFWMHGFWPRYRPHKTRWQPVNKKLDQYRFMMKGLGKRDVHTPYYQNTFDPHEDIEKDLEELDSSESETSAQSVAALTNFIILTKAYADILDSLEKRTPEVYSQKLYPIQGGTQRMEVEMDRKLNHLMEDDAVSRNEYVNNILHTNEDALDDSDSEMSDSKDIEFTPSKNYLINDSDSPLQEDKRDGINQKAKRWWAARKLKLFGLKTPKSMRRSYFRRAHIDPALYFMGLGR